MKIDRKDIGNIISVFGIFMILVAVSSDLVYFGFFIGTIIFFFYLYKNRKNFEHEIILTIALLFYFFFIIYMVIILGVLTAIPGIYTGILGAAFLLGGFYLSGYIMR